MKKNEGRRPCAIRYADTWIFSLSAVFLLLYFFFEVLAHLHLSPTFPLLARLLLLVVSCAALRLGVHLHARRTQSNRLLQRLPILFFVLYLYVLLNVTLLEKGFGRDALLGAESENARAFYLTNFVNFQPFKSIWDIYIRGLFKSYVAPYYVFLNLLGNVCVLMPLSVLLPRLFPAQRHWYVFVPTVLLSVILIESLQLAFMVGSCDVDDLILNVIGAVALYFLLRIPCVGRLMNRLLWGIETK